MDEDPLAQPLPEPNLEAERRAPFYQRVHGEAVMLERLLNFPPDMLPPRLRPFLVNIAKRLELTAADMKTDIGYLKSTLADSVKPVSIDG